MVKTSGIIKNNIYVPYLKLLSNKLRAHDSKVEAKDDLNNKSFFIILAIIYRRLRDIIYNDIIELK